MDHGEPCLRNAAVPDWQDIEFRWFLTQKRPPEAKEKREKKNADSISSSSHHLIFIGMNPAEATRFAGTKDHGDPTCARLLNACKNNKYPEYFRPISRLSFFNLVPIVDKHPDDAKLKWTKRVGKQQQEILELNTIVLQKLIELEDDFIVIPAFGVGLKPSDWRWLGFEAVLPVLKEIPEPDKRIVSVMSKDNKRGPYHPRNWSTKGLPSIKFTPSLDALNKLAQKTSHKH